MVGSLGVGSLTWDGVSWRADEPALRLLAGIDPGGLPRVPEFLASGEPQLETWAYLDAGLCEVRLSRSGRTVSGFLLAQPGLTPAMSFLLHELGTPLATARAAVELGGPEGTQAAAAALDRARALLVLARAMGQSAPRECERLRLTAVVRAAARLVSPALGPVDIPQEAPQLIVEAPRLLLEQVVANLLVNALRHGAPPVRVVLRTEPGIAVLEVSDGGPGFDWDAALAAGHRPSGPAGGMGVGLSVALALAARCGAQLTYRRRPSTVGMRLPLAG